ncbi:MAG: nicotinamide mononucleotide transporter [Marinicaulis sp.]|nr:nicotinamide riboside transporter PnuC [Marinicaulis sp.]NNE41691.1 nicotinamide mononucleotide transporter [Marinicaulis sp.]NNL88992.1 nicotinamide mononucleotide transporter [Marinicaulis sp.]
MLDFLIAMVGSRPIEIAAFFLGLINVTLLVRRSIWNYPFGMAMVTLYVWIFFENKLYGQSALQFVYFGIQAYGLMHWLGKRDATGGVIVRRLTMKQGAIIAAAVILASISIGAVMAAMTDAAAPFADGLTTAIFLAAQMLLALRYLENWILWIIGDVFAVGLYWSQDLQPTAALYAIFLVLSTIGYFNWRRAHRAGVAAT